MVESDLALPQSSVLYDVSLIETSVEGFELPIIDVDMPDINAVKQEIKNTSFDFSKFATNTSQNDEKKDIKRFLNEHFRYVGNNSENI